PLHFAVSAKDRRLAHAEVEVGRLGVDQLAQQPAQRLLGRLVLRGRGLGRQDRRGGGGRRGRAGRRRRGGSRGDRGGRGRGAARAAAGRLPRGRRGGPPP